MHGCQTREQQERKHENESEDDLSAALSHNDKMKDEPMGKRCDWCKTESSLIHCTESLCSLQQLNFCNELCLNNYKMNLFCSETQQHLQQLQVGLIYEMILIVLRCLTFKRFNKHILKLSDRIHSRHHSP